LQPSRLACLSDSEVEDAVMPLLQTLLATWYDFETWASALDHVCSPLRLQIRLENEQCGAEIASVPTLCHLAFRSRGIMSDVFFPTMISILAGIQLPIIVLQSHWVVECLQSLLFCYT